MEFLGGLFLVGLLLWWIIKADLDERDFKKNVTKKIEERDARELESSRQLAPLEERERHAAWEFEKQCWADKKEWSAQVAVARQDFETTERKEKALITRRAIFLNRCVTACRQAEDSSGRLKLEDLSRILGWVSYREDDTGATRHLHFREGAFSGMEDVAFFAHQEHPFPNEIGEGFFRSSDIIKWLEVAEGENETTLRWLEEWRNRLPTEG